MLQHFAVARELLLAAQSPPFGKLGFARRQRGRHRTGGCISHTRKITRVTGTCEGVFRSVAWRQADPGQRPRTSRRHWRIEDEISKLKAFDAAEHLRTPAARAEDLNLVLADGDPTEVRDALDLVARAQGMSQVAESAGVTRQGLYKTLGENGNPEFATVLRIITATGIRLTAEPAGAKPKTKAAASR